MNVDVVIAYRDMGCEHRRRAFAYVLDWYDRHGYRAIVESGDSDDQFTRASAINTAIRRSRADVIIQTDPDSLVDGIALVAAAVKAARADGLVVAHTRYLYLHRTATDAAFRYACEAMVGPTRRVAGDMVHLWHPRLPQSVPGGPGYAEQFALLAQYRDATAAGPEVVAELVRSR